MSAGSREQKYKFRIVLFPNQKPVGFKVALPTIVILSRQTDFITLDALVSLVDAGRKSTIRADIDSLENYFHIESRPGRNGGYRLALLQSQSVFAKHAVMLMQMRDAIKKRNIWIEGYDAIIMEQIIRLLLEVKRLGKDYII